MRALIYCVIIIRIRLLVLWADIFSIQSSSGQQFKWYIEGLQFPRFCSEDIQILSNIQSWTTPVPHKSIPAMAPFRIFLVASVAITFLLKRYTEAYMSSRSILATTLEIFVVQTVAWLVWRCFVYPHYFSPFRTLPGPSVCPLHIWSFLGSQAQWSIGRFVPNGPILKVETRPKRPLPVIPHMVRADPK